MKIKKLFTIFIFASISVMGIAGCSSNQKIETVDGRAIISDGKPEVDSETGLVSYKNAETGEIEQINRDQIKNMNELQN
ncbi:YgdI/YgdR family lipoprotein [Providencia rettgeri]|uniref:YgdI/YgdR family lipoprotein n=1 Tax=Providencia TaxID=586 RepID=UPI0014193931|nr:MULTISPECIES: YgdI/YgdR family lipoprotein [Providencia]EJD6375278.1 YgdI/YgdR family lipoprotein [Providencia rettgeri]EJD6375437.1 YgdI/YgdR family lipoprotein [Providencia rettgeri]ELR5033105.1 YgdI/YgdR family lipoprotein [Providencia rettgeri]ELR5033840.1 YgdI/YgdR family lipoprotein [Providencia rettgeri]ELR5131705.1 YgdI/YgdR family lipoprotein [Providencia rettgeri]